MDATWIVSANAGRARIFSQTSAAEPLQEIEDMVNSVVRLRDTEVETDSYGPTAATKSMHNVGGALPNKTYQPNQTPEQHNTELFARSIADFLLQGLREGRFRQVHLVAGPQFLGALRKELHVEVQSAVGLELSKDFTQYSGRELQDMLKAQQDQG